MLLASKVAYVIIINLILHTYFHKSMEDKVAHQLIYFDSILTIFFIIDLKKNPYCNIMEELSTISELIDCTDY